MDGIKTIEASLELWAGVECTVNRVGDLFFDQLERSGHSTRLEDIDLFADTGIRCVRYPILWERTWQASKKGFNWGWADERLGRLRELGIRPIVGLLHHGSGPPQTNLLDASFADRLAQFAGAFAQRYPWVESYTPVNEPLTTARFSGLYGHWYPHGRDGLTFIRALLNQCRAIALSMRAIRNANPQADLIQTEDMGKTFSTPKLRYQADFENERRWLTFDLLCGLVDDQHPMSSYFRWLGVQEAETRWFVDNPCPPDVIGINHYLTSERFLDERVDLYPHSCHGSNGKDIYADVEAVRVMADGVAGHAVLLREAWERYRLPLAVTEVHLGCAREEQLRWFKQAWDAAQELRQDGIDVKAVTAWAFLGSYDWASLVTRDEGRYEPGVFDLRGPYPRPTALARMLRDISNGVEHNHPALGSPGWWLRKERFSYPPVALARTEQEPIVQKSREDETRLRPILIAGANGTLGQAFARICAARALVCHSLSRQEMDVADAQSVERVLDKHKPWAVVNAAGYVRVDEAEREHDLCYRVNCIGPATLAAACARHDIALVNFSSDLVFDGLKKAPYIESDMAAPLNAYGRSKREAEAQVLEALPSALVIRTSAFFGPWDSFNFLTVALRKLLAGEAFAAADDIVISPTYIPDLVNASLDLLIDGARGLWHLTNVGSLTWVEFLRLAVKLAGIESIRIEARPQRAFSLAAPRPRRTALGSERGTHLPALEDAITRYFRESNISHAPHEKRIAAGRNYD